MTERIPDEAWATVVRSVPIVSVDLVVRHEGRVALGEREKGHPAASGSSPAVASTGASDLTGLHRVAHEELGVEVTVERRLGVYEHLYDVVGVPDASGKRYLPVGYVVRAASDDLTTDDQHAAFEWFGPSLEVELHLYVREYPADAGLVEK